MNTRLREAKISDVDDLIAISRNPQVAMHQYRRTPGDEMMFREVIENGSFGPNQDCKLNTILFKSDLVGYVVTAMTEHEDARLAQCGWDLHPDFWGQGIMTESLHWHFNELFDCHDRTHLIAECFSSNRRCIRLMDRIGLVRWRIPLTDRIYRMWHSKSLKWLLRFGTSIETWSHKTINAE